MEETNKQRRDRQSERFTHACSFSKRGDPCSCFSKRSCRLMSRKRSFPEPHAPVPSSSLRPALLCDALEHFRHPSRCPDLKHILLRELLRLWMPACSYLLCSRLPIVHCPPKFVPLRTQQEPVRAWPVSKGYPHAPRIENAQVAYLQLELDVRMPTDDDFLLYT